jgi:hypothetical protein
MQGVASTSLKGIDEWSDVAIELIFFRWNAFVDIVINYSAIFDFKILPSRRVT